MTRSVLMFCPQFRPLIGGAERQAEKLANTLVAAGCRVTLVTPRIDPNSPAIEESNGVRIERFPCTDLSRRFTIPGIALINIPVILWQFARAVRARLKGVDVIHCHIASLQTAGAALAGRLYAVPVLCKAAMADYKSDLGEIEKAGPSGRFVTWLIRALIPNWVATTEAVEQALVRAGVNSNYIVRIPNGVDLPEFSSQQARRDSLHRFLYLGRLSTNTQRDVPTLICAFNRLAARHPDIELAVVGGGDLLEETRALADTCEAGDRIQIPGFDHSDKWLAWADCFILPSRREGLSNALLEAMAAGLPCIANDIPPNREVLANGAAGVLVPVGDEERLFEAMQRMINDTDHAKAMRAAALSRVQSCYGIEAVAARYIVLYEDLIRCSVQ
ncbi:MAG: glycosyltransferase family 4 protein [Pseudomonadota bacterium]